MPLGFHWAAGVELEFDRFHGPPDMDTVTAPLFVRYFHPAGFFGGFGASYVHQDVRQPRGLALSEGNDDFMVVDCAVGYRLPGQRGLISVEATNLFGKDFKYQDDFYRGTATFEEAQAAARFIPERIVLGRIILNF